MCVPAAVGFILFLFPEPRQQDLPCRSIKNRTLPSTGELPDSPGPTQAGTQGAPTRLPSRMRLEKFGDKPPSHPAVPTREVPGHFPDSLEKQSSEPDRTRLGARQVSTVGACSFLCLSLFVTYSSQSEAAAAGEVSSTPTPLLVISSIRKIANESLQRRMHASGGTRSNKTSFDKRCLKRVPRHF